MSRSFLPAILAGGSGTRLWPLSREQHPKQFLRVIGDKSMLQHTLARLDGLAHEAPVIVCHHDHRFLVAEQCREQDIRPRAIMLEPAPRNTAPALALAAFSALAAGDPVLLALPADAYIGDIEAFHVAVEMALPFAASGSVVTFGITPSRAETGYGYIRAGATLPNGKGVAKVATFTEKPSSSMAQQYLATGDYYWNSGMFMVRASVYLDELRTFRPNIHAACAAAVAAQHRDLDFHRPGDAFLDSPADSIDYAVMENTQRALVVPTDMAWTDVGSWRTLAETLRRDDNGNTASGDVIALGTRNCYLAANDRLLAVVGLQDAVVVETSDAVLVAAKDRAQDVKRVVERLSQLGRDEHRVHTTVYRPWGRADTFKSGDGFLVKRITVAPGQALSLQMHRHRSEHWVVVRGEAEVRRGDETYFVTADASTYIPVGERHRLTNRGPEPLEVIEVQVGEHISEGDIVRFDDRYGRE